MSIDSVKLTDNFHQFTRRIIIKRIRQEHTALLPELLLAKNACLMFLLGSILFPALLSAQSFPTQNVNWQGVTFGIAGPIPYYQALCGDTTINEQSYNKLYGYYTDNEGNEISQYLAATRVNGPRVWTIEQNSTTEKILYDFSLEAGEQITVEYIGFSGEITIKVAAVSTLQVGGEFVKVLEFVPISGIEESWIEGIGSTRGPLFRAFTAVDGTSYLNCFRREGELVYRTVPENECDFDYECTIVSDTEDIIEKDKLQLYPSLSTGTLRFQNEHNTVIQLEAYNVNGRQMGLWKSLALGVHELNISNWPSGIYYFKARDLNKNIYLQHFKITLLK